MSEGKVKAVKNVRGRHTIEAWGRRLGIAKVGTDITDWSAWTQNMQDRCASDVAVSMALWRFMRPDGYSPQAIALEHRAAEVCEAITAAGMPFDMVAAKRLERHIRHLQAPLAVQFAERFPETNITSRQQVAELLEARGWTASERTPTGRPKLDDEVLAAAAVAHPEFAGLDRYLEMQRRLGWLVEGNEAITKHIGDDGRAHGGLVHCGTPHSRARHFRPNLAQVPSGKKGSAFGDECRGLFRPANGMVVVACDQSGLQDRGFCHFLTPHDGGAYAQTFLAGEDTHWKSTLALGLIAEGIERDKDNILHKTLREQSKRFRYAFLFGAGQLRAGRIIADAVRVAAALDPASDLPQKFFAGELYPSETALKREGKKARQAFLDATPGLEQLQLKLQRHAAQHEWLPGLDGRRVPVDAQYKALNRIVTSSEAIICKRWLVQVYDELRVMFHYGWGGDVVLVGWIHDELVACCRPEIAEQVGLLMVRHAREAGEFYHFRVPLDATYTIGHSWAGEPLDGQAIADTIPDAPEVPAMVASKPVRKKAGTRKAKRESAQLSLPFDDPSSEAPPVRKITPEDFAEVNAALAREGIAPIRIDPPPQPTPPDAPAPASTTAPDPTPVTNGNAGAGFVMRLEPDCHEVERFVNALFKHCIGLDGYVSLRAFPDNGARGNAPSRIEAVKLNGTLRPVIDKAVVEAVHAANTPAPTVFCPPLAILTIADHAREQDLLAVPTIDVELDQHPRRALATLEAVLGPATVVTASGGEWVDPQTGEVEDKLHGHWRLVAPALNGQFAGAKEARRLATALVDGDPSDVSPVHPIRWPGSWHRKKAPRLSRIIAYRPDTEIVLDKALATLKREAKAKGIAIAAADGPRRAPLNWNEAIGRIIAGDKDGDFHPVLASLSMSCAKRGMDEAITEAMLRALLHNTRTTDPQRLQRAASELDKLSATVHSAFTKHKQQQQQTTTPVALDVVTADVLASMSFPPLRFVVPDFVAEGLTLLAGKPKIGKSWLLLHMALAVAAATVTLGGLSCTEGDVLYAALEDNRRRLRRRMRKLWGDQPLPPRLHLAIEMQRLAAGGLDQIKSWIAAVPNPRLIVIDTLKMVRSPAGKNQSYYEADYECVKELRDLAAAHGIAIVVVHHLRKAEADDPFDTVSGTLGLTGAVDTIALLYRTGNGIVLAAKGRDVEEVAKAVEFDRTNCTWIIVGDADQVKHSAERAAILTALTEAGGELLGPSQIAGQTGMKVSNVRFLLHRMKAEGVVRMVKYGKYTLDTGPATDF